MALSKEIDLDMRRLLTGLYSDNSCSLILLLAFIAFDLVISIEFFATEEFGKAVTEVYALVPDTNSFRILLLPIRRNHRLLHANKGLNEYELDLRDSK